MPFINADTEQVFQSYGRCCRDETFFETFYKIFIGKSDEVRAMFTNTDMAEQRRLLRSGISWLIMYARGGSDIKLRNLAESHGPGGYAIPAHLYDVWVDSLMEAVAAYDPQFDANLEREWRAVLQPGIDILLEQAC